MATNAAKSGTRSALLKKLEELAEQQERIKKELEAGRSDELRSLVGTFKEHLTTGGFSVDEALKLLGGKKGSATRAARGTAVKKEAESLDKSGSKPERGSIYKHSSWPEPWTAKGKRTPNHVLATIKSGKTWASLLQK